MIFETDLKPPFCSEHNIPMVWGETDMRFEEDGIEVIIRHIPAWVCPHGDDAAFAPGVADEIFETIRDLVKVAKRVQSTHPALSGQEYLVRVAA
jgi:YgiT-type zinc finger domain-containing protein